jgi:hypothetical protein
MPQSPANLLEDIVCDADLFHLGTDEFTERNKLMRQECETHFKACLSKQEWRKSQRSGFIPGASLPYRVLQAVVTPKKEENLHKLLQKQEEDSKKQPDGADSQIVPTDPEPKQKRKRKKIRMAPATTGPIRGLRRCFV